MIVLGKIVGAYGLYGAVRIHPFADDPHAWAKLAQWWLGRESEAPEGWHPTQITKCKLHNESLIAELDGVSDRDAAEALKGVLVGAPREVLPPATKNEYYWADLIGLAVINVRDEPLGHVLGLIETPANDVLRVGEEVGKETTGKERLLPFVKTVVLDVDVAKRFIRVDWEMDW